MKKLLTTLTALLVAAITMAQVPSYVPTNGLVGWWPFNGNANDESGNGNNGTVNGATLTSDRFGNPNAAYDFDGVNDYIRIPDANEFDFGASNFSISVWVLKQTIFNTCESCNTSVIGKWYSDLFTGTNEWSLTVSQPDNIRLRIDQNPDVVLNSNTVVSTDTWYHVLYQRENTELQVYINGTLESTVAISGTIIPNVGRDITIGAIERAIELASSELFSRQKVDDIGIWNRALTQCEIEQLYLSQVIAQPSASVTTSGPTTFCQGGSVTLSVPQADNYIWSNGATSQSITVNSTGTYSVTVTNGNSCSETSQNISVTVNSLPNVSLSSLSSICDNAPSVTLAGGSPSGGSYTVNGTPSTEINPSLTGSGMQNVVYEYTDNNGCSNSATQTVMVIQSPSVSVSGLNTTYTPTDPAVQLNGTPSGGVYSGIGVTNDGVFDPAVAGIGTHNVQYVYVDGNGCIGVDGLCTSVDMNMNIGGSNIGTDGGSIDVYPNPSNGNFAVAIEGIEGIIGLSVFDARGREVMATSVVGNGQRTIQHIDLSNYANGVYTLSIRTAKGTASQKLVKE